MSIARCRSVVGSLYGLMRNALGLNVATPLGSQELSCTVAPERRLVVLGHEPIAGFARDHGTVADEAAMLALHTLDSATPRAEPTFVAPGDSCLRADDPGWRWHCVSGHGTQLSDWERHPLAGALAGLSVSGHTHALVSLTEVVAALNGKQAASANLDTLAGVASSAAGRNLMGVTAQAGPKLAQINADSSITLIDVPSGGGGASLPIARLTRSTQWDFSEPAGIPWQACETIVGAGMWESGTPSRLYAPSAGLWRVSAWLRTSGVTAVFFRRNGLDQVLGWRTVWSGEQTEFWTYDCAMSVGDYLEVAVYISGTVLYNEGNSPLCTWQRIG